MREGTAVSGIHKTSHLKSGLMIGAAGLAAAGMSTAAFAAGTSSGAAAGADNANVKWLPYASVGAGAGDATVGGHVDLFVPVWQDLNSLLFVRLGVGTQTRDDEIGNFALGYRTKFDSDWIFGVYGGFDASHTKFGHSFTQGSVGAEVMSADWDARINAYLATSDQLKNLSNHYELYIHDTRIAMLQGQEGAYSGFDGEVGYRVFSTDNTDVRLFAGGFYFSRNDANNTSGGRHFNFGYGDIAGPMGRAEVDIYDIDALGAQSRVTITGQISHDDVRGTSGYVGASLRIPLGSVWGEGGQALSELDRRMVDPLRRQDNVLTEWEYSKPEPVIIYNGTISSQPTNTLYYVEGGGTGSGSYADMASLGDATSGGASNPFIVLTDFGGPITGGVTVHAGQTLVAGGHTFSVRGADSGHVVDHAFAPGSGTPALAPATAGGNIITIDGGNASIYGMDFTGDFGAAIYGHNVSNVDISNVNIDGSGGGQYGVQIYQDQSQDMNLHITDSTITGVGQDGVQVYSNVSDGGTSNQTLELTNSTISGSGGTNVVFGATTSGGSTVNQTIVIDPTYIYGGDFGVLLGGAVDGTGSYLYQNISISDVYAAGATYDEIAIYGSANNGGTLVQKISLNHVTAVGSYEPIFIGAQAKYSGSVTQQIDMTNVGAYGATAGENIAIYGVAAFGGTVHQSGTWTGVTAVGGIDDGLEIGALAFYGGSVNQNFAISYLYALGNYQGVDIWNAAIGPTYDYGLSLVTQYVSIDHALVSNAGVASYASAVGAYTYAAGYYGAALQKVTLNDSTVTYSYYGLKAYAGAAEGGSAQQYVYIDHSHFDYNYRGANFLAYAGTSGFTAQTLYVNHSTFSHNTGDGLDLYAVAIDGGNVEQYGLIYHTRMSHNGNYGLYAGAYAKGYFAGPAYYYYAQVTQNLIVAYSSANWNSSDGANLYAYAKDGGEVNQFAEFYGVDLSHNAGNGLFAYAGAGEPAYFNEVAGYIYGRSVVYSNLYVINSTAADNGESGIRLNNYAFDAGVVIQYATFDGLTASHNHADGLTITNASAGYYDGVYYYTGYLYQSVSATDSHFDYNAGYGINAHNYAVYGGSLVQVVSLYSYVPGGTTLSHNGNTGIQITSFSGYGADPGYRLINALYLTGVYAGNNYGNGAGLAMYAFGTKYVGEYVKAYDSAFYDNARESHPVYGLGVILVSGQNYFVNQYVRASGDYFYGNAGVGLGVALVDGNHYVDNGSFQASQVVVAGHNYFIDNAEGFGQVAALYGTYFGYQYSVLYDNVFAGGVYVNMGPPPIYPNYPGFHYFYGNFSGNGATISFTGKNNYYAGTVQVVYGNQFYFVPNDALRIDVASVDGNIVYDYTYVGHNNVYVSGGSGIKIAMYALGESMILNNPSNPYITYPDTAIVVANNYTKYTGLNVFPSYYYIPGAIQIGLYADIGAFVGAGPDGTPFKVQVSGNTVHSPYGDGIGFFVGSYAGSYVNVDFAATQNSVYNSKYNGIHVGTFSAADTRLYLSDTIAHNYVSNVEGAGIFINNDATGAGVTHETNGIYYNTIAGTHYCNGICYYAGTGIAIRDSGDSAYIGDASYILHNAESGQYTGVYLFTSSVDDTVHQYTEVKNNGLYNNAIYGIDGRQFGGSYQTIKSYGLNTQYNAYSFPDYYHFFEGTSGHQTLLP